MAQFQDALVIPLLIATVISAALWLYERESALPYEAMAIFSVVLLNAVMGYIQESRAESAVAALRQMSAARAKVFRGGALRNIPAIIAVVMITAIILIQDVRGFLMGDLRQPFPEGNGKWQVSVSRGVFPRWRGDGRELFYVTPAMGLYPYFLPYGKK